MKIKLLISLLALMPALAFAEPIVAVASSGQYQSSANPAPPSKHPVTSQPQAVYLREPIPVEAQPASEEPSEPVVLVEPESELVSVYDPESGAIVPSAMNAIISAPTTPPRL